MTRGGSVYIITNKNHTTLYTGVTSDLYNRIVEHKSHKYPFSFSAKYNLEKLVYYRNFYSIEEAISEEKRIKAGSRKAKIKLIEIINAEWYDLFELEVKHW